MEIHGREIHFRRTVLGNCEIAELCPGKDINKFAELIQGDYSTAQKAAAAFIVAMNKGYEMAMAFEDPGHSGKPLTLEEVMLLDNDAFNNLFEEALKVFADDGKTTVDAEPVKGKNASGDNL